MKPPKIYKTAFAQKNTKNGWLEYGVSWCSGVYSFNIDLTFFRDRRKLDGFDIRFSLIGFDSFVRWTRKLKNHESLLEDHGTANPIVLDSD